MTAPPGPRREKDRGRISFAFALDNRCSAGPAVAADGAGMTAFRGMTSFHLAPPDAAPDARGR
jgi:hypothetical protein